MTEDDVSNAELAMYVERLHRAPAKYLESVEVKETFEGQTVWQGAVKCFSPAHTRALPFMGTSPPLKGRAHERRRCIPLFGSDERMGVSEASRTVKPHANGSAGADGWCVPEFGMGRGPGPP
jgi:hypothetical protein